MQFFKKYFGPSTLVAAAFVGPGTLTVCTLAGAAFGYDLLWALLFSVAATVLLQEMAARLGLVTQKGLGEAIRTEISRPVFRWLSGALVFIAIVVGNAAYEAGNISGAVLGIEGMLGNSFPWAAIIGALAFLILWMERFKLIERLLVSLVLLMSVVFLVTAVMVKPSAAAIFSGLFIPRLSEGSEWAVLALIGTTVVPYNLFLHASVVNEKWKRIEDLPDLKKENGVAVITGGLISMAIVIASAATLFGGNEPSSIGEMAEALTPLLGNWSGYFLGMGLFAAGLSSAITAPLAAAYTARGIFGWNATHVWRYRLVWIFVLMAGTVFSLMGYRPIQVIQVAQVANGVLLPVMVFFLIYLNNKQSLMGPYVNKKWQNVLAAFVVLVSVMISFRSLNGVFSFL